MVILACAVLCTISGISAQTAVQQPEKAVYHAEDLGERIACESWFSRDKFLHFSASAALTGLSHHVYVRRLRGDPDQGGMFSVSLTGLIAFSKELYDKNHKGTFSWKDLFWDGLGIAVGYFVFIR